MRSGFILNGRIARLPNLQNENCDDDSEKESFGAPVGRNRACGLDIENEDGGARVTVFIDYLPAQRGVARLLARIGVVHAARCDLAAVVYDPPAPGFPHMAAVSLWRVRA